MVTEHTPEYRVRFYGGPCPKGVPPSVHAAYFNVAVDDLVAERDEWKRQLLEAEQEVAKRLGDGDKW